MDDALMLNYFKRELQKSINDFTPYKCQKTRYSNSDHALAWLIIIMNLKNKHCSQSLPS